MTKHSKKQKTKQTFRFDDAFRASLWPSLHNWKKNCNQSNCNLCQLFFLLFQEERFAFSRDTRDDAVFTSLAGKIPQVNFIVSLFFVSIYILVSLTHQRIKSQGVECLKRRFGVGGCLIMLDCRCKLGVLNWDNISNYLHLWNMFIYLVMCFFIYFLIYLQSNRF